MQQEGIYFVEKIFGKRIYKNKLQYYIKWKGYSVDYATWEHVENLNCDRLIKKFEDTLKHTKNEKKFKKQPKRRNTSKNRNEKADGRKIKKKKKEGKKEKQEDIEEREENKEEKGNVKKKILEPESIIGVIYNNGKFKYLIKRKGTSQRHIITSDEAVKVCPQLVIEYFVERIIHDNPNYPNPNLV